MTSKLLVTTDTTTNCNFQTLEQSKEESNEKVTKDSSKFKEEFLLVCLLSVWAVKHLSLAYEDVNDYDRSYFMKEKTKLK